MEGVCVENVVPVTSNLHSVAFINIKFHLPGEFPLMMMMMMMMITLLPYTCT